MCSVMKTFCCFLSLEVGAQIISIVSTLLSVFITVLYVSAAVFLKLSQTKQLFYAGMALAGGLQCLFGGVLSYGAFQRRPGYMWPWLLVAWTTGCALLAVSIVGTAALIIGGQLSTDVNIVIFAYVIYALFLLYCACVVNSRRLELVREKDYVEKDDTLMSYHHPWRYA